jgi:hypothetical protein
MRIANESKAISLILYSADITVNYFDNILQLLSLNYTSLRILKVAADRYWTAQFFLGPAQAPSGNIRNRPIYQLC